MVKGLALVLLLVAAGYVAPYPRYEEVVRNPREFDLLFSSTVGSHNETWYFDAVVNFTSIIIPSQSFDPCISGGWTTATYKEEIDIFVYETRLASNAANAKTNLVATGSYNGTSNFGQELHIPLWNATLDTPLLVQRYINSYTGCTYRVSIVFKTSGFYPWYTTRMLNSYSPVGSGTNAAGIAIGLSYTTK